MSHRTQPIETPRLVAARQMLAAGMSVVPVRADGSKAPALRGWKEYQDRHSTPAEHEQWFGPESSLGIGVVCGVVSGNLLMIEVEGRAADCVPQIRDLAFATGQRVLWDKLNSGWTELSPSGGFHWFIRTDHPTPRNQKIATDADGVILAETRGEGGYVIVAPSNGMVHHSGKPYKHLIGGPESVQTFNEDELEDLHTLFATALGEAPAKFNQPDRAPMEPVDGLLRPGDDYEATTDWKDILPPAGWVHVHTMGDELLWRRPGKTGPGWSASTGHAKDRDRLYVFSTNTGLPAEEPITKFHAYTHFNHGGDHKAAAAELRKQGYGSQYGGVEKGSPSPLNEDRPTATGPSRDDEDRPGSEVHRGQARIAYKLAASYQERLMHVHGLGWHYWDNSCWKEDKTGRATRAVLAVLRKALADSLNEPDLRQDVRKCESASGIEGVLRIAKSLPELAATPEQLDANPYLLNVANGTLDLHTMQLRPHDPADRITRRTAAAWNPSADSHVWEAFLTRVLPDADVRGFLQRYAGVALVGKVLEHLLAILTGKGRNGKGVWYGAFNTALGDYAATAEPDLFMHREGAHPTGEMDLRGRRFVVVSESDKDRPFAEATVKRLTGGDTIRARRLFHDFTEFPPSHTAALVTNHLPKVSGDDAAIWARLRVVPFLVVIPDEEQDPHLPEKLELELDAILAWAVAGWQAYQQHGLAEPDAVLAATADYHHDADALGRFISEECDTGPGHSALTESLHHAFSEWAAAEGLAPMSKRAFGIALENRGYEARKGGKGVRIRAGIQLKPVRGSNTFGGSGGE